MAALGAGDSGDAADRAVACGCAGGRPAGGDARFRGGRRRGAGVIRGHLLVGLHRRLGLGLLGLGHRGGFLQRHFGLRLRGGVGERLGFRTGLAGGGCLALRAVGPATLRALRLAHGHGGRAARLLHLRQDHHRGEAGGDDPGGGRETGLGGQLVEHLSHSLPEPRLSGAVGSGTGADGRSLAGGEIFLALIVIGLHRKGDGGLPRLRVGGGGRGFHRRAGAFRVRRRS